MAPCLLLAIILHCFLLGNAQHLTVHPVDPVVAVGSSIQLNCSLNCSSGRVAWKGLDIYQTNQIIAPGYSVQTLENISISIGGRKYCEGTCPGQRKTYHKSVELHVYALPKTLLLSNSMKNGVHYLNCSVERVLPPLHITCYRGSEMLGEPIDINEVPVVDDLYNVMGSWVIPEEDWLSQASYRCEAEVSVNGQVFKSQGVLNISSKEDTTTAITDSSTTQTTSVQSQKPETPYLTTSIGPSQDPQTVQSVQERTTMRSQPENTTAVLAKITSTQSLTPEMPYGTPTIGPPEDPQTVQWVQQSTTISRLLILPDEYTIKDTINKVNTHSTQPTKTMGPKPIDGFYIMWIIVPATGLIGSLVLFVHIYRQLSKKGFFQPNHMELSNKNGTKTQESSQAVCCHNMSSKKKFSMY